jgi:hypothetical protein
VARIGIGPISTGPVMYRMPKDMPWFNNTCTIKKAINKRNKLYKKFTKENNNANFKNFKDQNKVVAEM